MNVGHSIHPFRSPAAAAAAAFIGVRFGRLETKRGVTASILPDERTEGQVWSEWTVVAPRLERLPRRLTNDNSQPRRIHY